MVELQIIYLHETLNNTRDRFTYKNDSELIFPNLSTIK